MKKYISYFILLLIVIFITSVFLISCKAQEPINQSTTVTKNYQRQIDSLKLLVINRAIQDKLKIPVPNSNSGNKSVDSLVNIALNDILSKLNYSKISGDNSFELLYDALKRELSVNTKVGETTSEKTNVKDKITDDTSTDKKEQIVIKKPYNNIEKSFFGIAIAAILFGLYKAITFFRKQFKIA